MKKFFVLLTLMALCLVSMQAQQRNITVKGNAGNPVVDLVRGDTKTDTLNFNIGYSLGNSTQICWSLTGTKNAITGTHKTNIAWYAGNTSNQYTAITSTKDSIMLPTTRKIATGTLTNFGFKNLRAIVINSDSATLKLDVMITQQ